MFPFLKTKEETQTTLGLKRVPYDHQMDALRKIASTFNHGYLIADEPGLGKTFLCLMYLKIRRLHWLKLRENGRTHFVYPSIIMAPLSALETWKREALLVFEPDEILEHHGSHRNVERFNMEKVRRTALVITTHAVTFRDGVNMLDTTHPMFDCVVLDEGHILHSGVRRPSSNPKRRRVSNTSDVIMSFKNRSQVRLVVTGTPFRNSVKDLYIIRDFIEEKSSFVNNEVISNAPKDPDAIDISEDYGSEDLLTDVFSDPMILLVTFFPFFLVV